MRKEIIILVLLGIIMAFAIITGINRQEQTTCNQYQKWAKEYPLFYMTQLDKEMCDNWGIQVDAPVLK